MNRTHLDLFSGIGGFALACRWAGVETIGFAEIDDYASRVLAKNFPGVPNYGDVRNVPDGDGTTWLVTGGFPCQPFSVAGKQEGAADDRYLWPEMASVIDRCKPTWAICENVPGITSMELDNIIFDLERIGYTSQAFVIPAVSVGAWHDRKRIWIVANSDGEQFDDVFNQCSTEGSETLAPLWTVDFMDVDFGNRVGKKRIPQPDIRRVADGVPARVDRLRGLGNAIVPQVAYQLIRFMVQVEEERYETQ